MCLSFGFPDEKQSTGAYSKVSKRRKTTDGGVPPGTSASTKLSPKGATEYLTCLISTCIYLCRPLGAFSFVASLPGVNTPVCGLSRLRRLFSGQQQSPIRSIRGFTIPSAFAIRVCFVAESFSPNPFNPFNPWFYNSAIRSRKSYRLRKVCTVGSISSAFRRPIA